VSLFAVVQLIDEIRNLCHVILWISVQSCRIRDIRGGGRGLIFPYVNSKRLEFSTESFRLLTSDWRSGEEGGNSYCGQQVEIELMSVYKCVSRPCMILVGCIDTPVFMLVL